MEGLQKRLVQLLDTLREYAAKSCFLIIDVIDIWDWKYPFAPGRVHLPECTRENPKENTFSQD